MIRKEQDGFSLIEVIISLAFLSIVSLSLLSFFGHSARVETNTERVEDAIFIGDSIMEEVKACPSIEVIGGQFEVVSSPGITEYKREGIVQSLHTYDVTVKVNTSSSAAMGVQTVNAVSLPEVHLVDAGDSVSFLADPLEALVAKNYFEGEILEADERVVENYNNEKDVDDDAATVQTRFVPYPPSSAWSKGIGYMTHTTKVQISPSVLSGRLVVSISSEFGCRYRQIRVVKKSSGHSYNYTFNGSSTTLTYTASEVRKTISVSDLKRVYLFLYHSDFVPSSKNDGVTDSNDKVVIEKDSSVAVPPDLELILSYQKNGTNEIDSENWELKIEDTGNVFSVHRSNLKEVTGTTGIKALVTEDKKRDRTAEVTVEVYDTGYRNDPEHLLNSYTSTVALLE